MSIRNNLMRLIFPPHCAACRQLLPFDGAGGEVFLCRACRGAFEAKKLETCPVCGASFVDCRCMPEALSDADCVALIKLVPYDPQELRDVVNKLINNCKRYRNRDMFDFLARQLCVGIERVLSEQGVVRQDAVVTFCPRGRRRRREYGFDQAQLLASYIAYNGGYEMATLLTRKRGPGLKSQKSLGGEARVANAGRSLALAEGVEVVGKTVILVDDVVTTGVGMAEAIKVLKKGGAAEVVPVCVAVTVKKHQGAAFPKFS